MTFGHKRDVDFYRRKVAPRYVTFTVYDGVTGDGVLTSFVIRLDDLSSLYYQTDYPSRTEGIEEIIVVVVI